MPAPPKDRESEGLSLEVKLPLLITGIIAAVAIGIAAASYGEVRRSAELALYAELSGVSDLANTAATSLNRRLEVMRDIAADPSIRRFLRGDTTAAARAATVLDTLPDQPGPAGPRLWTADRHVILGDPPPVPEPGGGVADAGALAVPDSGGVGPLFLAGEDPFFWSAIPVVERGRVLGWVAVLTEISGGSSSLASLVGEDVAIRFADDKSGVWLSLDATPLQPPAEWPFEGAADFTLADTIWHAVATRIPGTSLHVIAAATDDALMARPRAFLRWVALAASALVAIGAFVAWLLSRSVTRPLRQLETASVAMASGEYDQRVELNRQDELGTLAASFTHMASQVREARAELEQQYGEARSLAAELAHTNDVLEHAIREAERSRAEAHQASRAKSEFLATMSHEIRTPINAMIGYTDLLELGVAGPLNETQQNQLARIRASGQHLIGLVDEVLDLAGVESGRMRIEPRDGRIEDAVGTALAIVQPQAMGKQIEIRVSRRDGTSTPYRGDPRRVEQILVNLLTNAVKFTPSGGEIRIECAPVYEGDAQWGEVVVQDSGPGVDPDLHERIFEPFVQADAGYTRAHGGVGLGLAISRRLARMMGGDITVDSAPGSGARFRVRLPSEANEPEAARSA